MGTIQDSRIDNRNCTHGRYLVCVDEAGFITCDHCGEPPLTQHIVDALIVCDGDTPVWTMGEDSLVIHRCGRDEDAEVEVMVDDLIADLVALPLLEPA